MYRLIAPILLAFACGGSTTGSVIEDSGDAAEPVDVAQICEKVMECGGWGWQDQAGCESGFIDNATLGTECASTGRYRENMDACMGVDDCDEFESCERETWDAWCPSR